MSRVATIRIILISLLAILLSACGERTEHVVPEADYEQYSEIYEPEPDEASEPLVVGEIEEINLWHPDNFTHIRQPLYLSYETPHGYISVRHIEFMNDNLYNRAPFSYREKEAAVWIMEELMAMGYNWDDIYVQEFDWFGVEEHAERWFNRTWLEVLSARIMGDALPRNGRLSQNIVLTVPGQSEQKIIVGAHYDSPPYPSASDNASGVALLLESAQRMLHHDNYHTIVYVFFGAEEPGLFGAYHFMNSLSPQEQDDLLIMINADSLFEGPYTIFGAGYVPTQYWWDGLPEGARSWWPVALWWVDNLEPRSNGVTTQIDGIAAALNTYHGTDLITDSRFMLSPSDHWIFAWEGHTVLNLIGMIREEANEAQVISGFSTGTMHSSQDCIHHINEVWPGKINANMHSFSIFLEEILLSQF